MIDSSMNKKRKQAVYWYLGFTAGGFLLVVFILPAIF